MSMDTLLKDEIADELNELGNLELGSEKYKVTVEGLTKLMDRSIELNKFDTERDDKLATIEMEQDLKVKQMKDENKHKIIGHVINVLGIGTTFALTVWGTLKTFEFEEEGTVTSLVGRGFINKLIPKK